MFSNQAWIDKKVTKIPINSVLITCTATIGKVAVSKIELTTNQQINALVCDEKKVIAEYLAYYMLTQKENLENLTSNSGVKHINMKMLNNFKIPLPPLNIQEEIVKACQKVDDEVGKANEIIEEIKRKIEEEISAVGNNFIKLGDYSELITKGTTPTSIGYNFTSEGINFIKIESITTSSIFDVSKISHINDDCHTKMSRSQLKKNDILFSIAGALGRAIIVNDDILPANTNQALAIIRLKKDINLNVKYLFLILKSDFIQKEINNLKKGIAQSNLSLAQISNFKIPLPTLKTQNKIVSKIEILEIKIAEAKEIVEGASFRKEEVLKLYL